MKLWKRAMALLLVAVMSFMLPSNDLAGHISRAASSKRLYIGELKVVMTDGTTTPQQWCDSQTENKDDDESNDWRVIEHNLNSGAAGRLSQDIGVFLCYQTTSDENKAIRDIAVMNEKGNYSVGEYERLLKEQKDVYTDMVNNMKDMLSEYRTNYEKKLPTAVQAHDFLNAFIEDDSGKLLGDLLLDISDADLANLLLQMNGDMVLTVQQQIAAACDTGKSTWLDRMVQLGSFGALRKKFLTAYKNNARKADAALEKNYHDKAMVIYDAWDDIHQHFNDINNKIKKQGLDEMSEKELDSWAEGDFGDSDASLFLVESSALESLGCYKYKVDESSSSEQTLFDYFYQDKKAFDGENIKYLYPLAASLSDGQIAAMRGTVSFFNILQDGLKSGLYNDYSNGQGAELKEKISTEEKETINEIKDYVDKTVDEWSGGEKISVYEGVDRQIFEGGVAVTSAAEKFSEGTEASWADRFVDNGGFKKCMIGLSVSSILSGICSFTFKIAQSVIYEVNLEAVRETMLSQSTKEANILTRWMQKYDISEATVKYIRDNPVEIMKHNVIYGEAYHGTKDSAIEGMCTLDAIARNGKVYKLYKALKVGFAVFAVLLAVADITLTAVTLYKYYNREHMPIPRYMVDMTYDELQGASYIAYKSVYDNNGNCGDTNGGSCKQWLALYATKDRDAGAPILAPDNNERNFILQTGKGGDSIPTGYSSLHLFGKPNVAQNLTFADGENGWSYNDEHNGTYFFFRHEDTQTSDADSAIVSGMDAGTALGTGMIVLIGAAGLVTGIFIGAVITSVRRRKRRLDIKDDQLNG